MITPHLSESMCMLHIPGVSCLSVSTVVAYMELFSVGSEGNIDSTTSVQWALCKAPSPSMLVIREMWMFRVVILLHSVLANLESPRLPWNVTEARPVNKQNVPLARCTFVKERRYQSRETSEQTWRKWEEETWLEWRSRNLWTCLSCIRIPHMCVSVAVSKGVLMTETPAALLFQVRPGTNW